MQPRFRRGLGLVQHYFKYCREWCEHGNRPICGGSSGIPAKLSRTIQSHERDVVGGVPRVSSVIARCAAAQTIQTVN